jgi:hypothetical protein
MRAMNVTLLRALVALLPACVLLSGSTVMFVRGKTVFTFLQLLGAGCLALVVLTHVTEALHLFPSRSKDRGNDQRYALAPTAWS